MHLLFLASRTLLFRRGSFALLLLAISGSLCLQITNSANLEGYSQELFKKGIVYAIGHVIVSPKDSDPIPDSDSIASRISALDFIDTVALRFAHPGVMFHQGFRHPVSAVGLQPAAEERANRLCSRVSAGRCYAAAGTREMLVGRRLADKLHIAPGDSVELVLPLEDMDSVRYVKARFTVVGVLALSGGFSILEFGTFVPIEELRQLLEWRGAATSMHLYLKRPSDVAQAAAEVQRLIGAKVQVQPWYQVNADIASAITSNETINRISQAMVILAVIIPTLALLWINVIREERQIAALLAIGFTRASLFLIYLLRAALLAILGTSLGACAGLALCRWFQAHPLYSDHGFVVIPALHLSQLASSIGLVALVTVLGGLAPAIQAAWSNPIQVLRGG